MIVLNKLPTWADSELELPDTPLPVTPESKTRTVPLSIRSHKHGDELEVIPPEERPRSYLSTGTTYIIGNLVQAESGAQMAKELEHTETVERCEKLNAQQVADLF